MKTKEKQSAPRLNLFPNGQVEVGNGKPGYDWVPAYSEASDRGVSQPLTLSNWRAMAKRDGQKIVMHDSEELARAAITKATGGAK